MKIKEISKQDTNIFKAIGILLIVLHNYFRWVAPNTGENEFSYSFSVIKNLINGIIKTPLESINLFFDYFGHYGVQIFVFVSGVGLALSMLHKKTSYGTFILKRFKALYAMLIVGIVFYWLSRVVLDYHILNVNEWRELLWKILLVHTVIPREGLSAIGPWWFFGAIAQLYLLFPLLFHIIKKYNLKGCIAVCLFSFICSYLVMFVFPLPEGIEWRANSIALLPEFAFGIFIAMNPQKKIPPAIFWAALITFISGNISKAFFPLSFLSITIVFYFAISQLIPVINKSNRLKTILLNIGTLSMAIFIIHGFFRWRFVAIFSSNWFEKFIGFFLFFITVYALSIVANIFYKRIHGLFDGISKKIMLIRKRQK